MRAELAEALSTPWVDDELGALRRVELAYQAHGDRRAVFATAYVEMCHSIRRRESERAFASPRWVRRLGIAFANLYREALWAAERGERDTAPAPWRQALALSDAEPVLTHLLLGLSAHINHDLPIALAEVLQGEPLERCRADYAVVQEAGWKAIDAIQREVAHRYGPGLALLDRAGGPLDEIVTWAIVRRWRDRGWARAHTLMKGGADAELCRRELEVESARIGVWLGAAWLPGAARALGWLERQAWSRPDERHVERRVGCTYAWAKRDLEAPREAVARAVVRALGVGASESAGVAGVGSLALTHWHPPNMLEARSLDPGTDVRVRVEAFVVSSARTRLRFEVRAPGLDETHALLIVDELSQEVRRALETPLAAPPTEASVGERVQPARSDPDPTPDDPWADLAHARDRARAASRLLSGRGPEWASFAAMVNRFADDVAHEETSSERTVHASWAIALAAAEISAWARVAEARIAGHPVPTRWAAALDASSRRSEARPRAMRDGLLVLIDEVPASWIAARSSEAPRQLLGAEMRLADRWISSAERALGVTGARAARLREALHPVVAARRERLFGSVLWAAPR